MFETLTRFEQLMKDLGKEFKVDLSYKDYDIWDP
jgi:hypothetical protein